MSVLKLPHHSHPLSRWSSETSELPHWSRREFHGVSERTSVGPSVWQLFELYWWRIFIPQFYMFKNVSFNQNRVFERINERNVIFSTHIHRYVLWPSPAYLGQTIGSVQNGETAPGTSVSTTEAFLIFCRGPSPITQQGGLSAVRHCTGSGALNVSVTQLCHEPWVTQCYNAPRWQELFIFNF